MRGPTIAGQHLLGFRYARFERVVKGFALSYAVRNKGEGFPLPSLPSPSSLRDATSPKVRGLGSLPKIVGHLVLRQTFTAFSRDFTGKEL